MSQSLWSCQPASIVWTQDQPEAPLYQDLYYSKDDGMAESHTVFVEGNHLPSRFQQLSSGARFTVAETGFGTGLNFLMTWRAWRQHAGHNTRFFFVSCERHPLKKTDAERALGAWKNTDIAPLCDALLTQWPEPVAGTHRLSFDDGRVTLDIGYGEASDVLAQRRDCDDDVHDHGYASVDAWMLDGFAPSKNPELWNQHIYRQMAALSNEHTTLSTFTAAGHVRRGLQEAGFSVTKAPGFGHKRERLEGSFKSPAEAEIQRRTLAWHTPPAAEHGNAIIVGAGLAGAHTARALADRGWQVTVLEKQSVGAGSSGNPIAATFTRVSPHENPLSRFAVLSYLHALRQLQGHPCFEPRGVLQLMHSEKQQQQWRQLSALCEPQSWVQCLSPLETAVKLGRPNADESTMPSIWFPSAGTVKPALWCAERLNHPNITVLTSVDVISIQALDTPAEHRWQLEDAQGRQYRSDNLVLCCAHHTVDLLPDMSALIRGIRGQLSQLPAGSTPLGHQDPVVCHEGYLIPAQDGSATIGATYDLNSDRADLKASDDIDNLMQSEKVLAPMGLLRNGLQAAPLRAAVRCASRDYLPLVGAVPDIAAMSTDFKALRRDAKKRIEETGSYIPGLYINVAHGSRGSTSVPLSSEYLASVMNADPRPLEREMAESLSPARFLIRQLKRNQ